MFRAATAYCLLLALLAASCAAQAQQGLKRPQLGVLGNISAQQSPSAHLWAAFRQGLRDLGYVEGQNIVIHGRWPESSGRWSDAAAELVRLKVDLIVAGNSEVAVAAAGVTSTIPIVAVSGDPIAGKLVASLTRPGGNVTGLSTLSSEIIGKQLQLLKEVLPRLARVAVLRNPNNPFHAAQASEAEAAAAALGMEARVIEARSPEDLDRAFSAMEKARADALLVLADSPFHQYRTRIADLAAKARLPAMYPRREHVEVGGLIAYGTDRRDVFRRLAVYVDKILKGAKPADLPVEQPIRFELIVNAKTARALNLSIPPSLMQRADHVIK